MPGTQKNADNPMNNLKGLLFISKPDITFSVLKIG